MRALGRRISDGVQRTSALTRLTWSATEGGQFLSRMLSGTTLQQPNISSVWNPSAWVPNKTHTYGHSAVRGLAKASVHSPSQSGRCLYLVPK